MAQSAFPHDLSSLRNWFDEMRAEPVAYQLGKAKTLLMNIFSRPQGQGPEPTASNSSHAMAGAWALADLQDAWEGDDIKLLLMLKPEWVKQQLEKLEKETTPLGYVNSCICYYYCS